MGSIVIAHGTVTFNNGFDGLGCALEEVKIIGGAAENIKKFGYEQK